MRCRGRPKDGGHDHDDGHPGRLAVTGLYALACAGLVYLAFLAGRRFPVDHRGEGLLVGTFHGREHREHGDEAAAEVAVPRLTGPVAASSATVSADAFAALDRRVSALERNTRRRTRPQQRTDRSDRPSRTATLDPLADEPPLDKPAAVSHYEALADQVARERRLAEVEPRGRVMRFPSRPLAVAREHQDR